MKDQLVLMYVKDDEIYPVLMTESQQEMLQTVGKVFEPIRVVTDSPQGSATDLRKK